MLSVLIIEDTQEKIASIKDIIDNLSEKIEYEIVNDAKNATYKLYDKYYDLLLVDIHIPFEWGGNAEAQIAIELIKQIIEDDDLNTPFSILSITKKEDLKEEYKKELERLTVTILQYKENNDTWKHQLREKLKSLSSAKKSLYYQKEYDYDIAIINALQEPEHSQLINVFGGYEKWKRIQHPMDDFNNYYECILEIKNKKIRCIATYANQMASIASSALTTKIIYNFRPKYLFMTGITAGIPNDNMNFGDILVASEVYDGASGKIKTNKENGNTIFEPDVRQKSTNTEFINIITRLKSDNQLLSNIANRYPSKQGKPNTELNIHIGPMASVPAVLSCKEEIDKIKGHERKLQGIEMEAYGMFYAASCAIKPLPKFVASLKSVSDFADIQKNDNYQEYASYTSASLLKYIIENELEF